MNARLALACFGLLLTLPGEAHMGPHPEAGIEFDQHIGSRVPASLSFVDASGARTTLGTQPAPTVLVLGYLGCRDLCATTLPGVAEALDGAGMVPGRDYRGVFASIDAREGPAMLAKGFERLPASDRPAWRFLGGNPASAEALARDVGFRYRYELEHDAFAHPAGFVVLTPDGTVSKYFFGVRFDARAVGEAVRAAGEGATGSVAQRLLLLCYHFDPATGRYSLAILDALRVLIGACALGLAAWAWHRRRARERAA
jgi:protein SCO1